MAKAAGLPVGRGGTLRAAEERDRSGEANTFFSGKAAAKRVKFVNDTLSRMNIRLRFDIAAGPEATTGLLVVEADTGEVIREMPLEYFNKATVDFAEGAEIAGAFLDEEV